MDIRQDRRHPDAKDFPDRTPAQRDRDRILHASSFRRLAGITQVVGPGEGQLFHNRLTHVLKVAQIGGGLAARIVHDSNNEELAKKLGGLDPNAVEAAALAHDLGHPPFGHVGERTLDQIVKESGMDLKVTLNPFASLQSWLSGLTHRASI